MPFEEYSKFILSCNVHDATLFTKFMFDSAIYHGTLKCEWEKLLDHEYVKDKLISVLDKHSAASKNLLKELILKHENGFIANKSAKQPTIPEAFSLTVVNPRNFPEPTTIISNEFKVIFYLLILFLGK